jgi:hypothetical protein
MKRAKCWKQMLVLMMVLCIGVMTSACGSQTVTQTDLLVFPQTEWGMSKAAVKAVYGDLEGESTGIFSSYRAVEPVELCGQSAELEFSFFEKDGKSYLIMVTATYSKDLSEKEQMAVIRALEQEFDIDAALQGTVSDLEEREQALYAQNTAYLNISGSGTAEDLYQCEVRRVNGRWVQLVLKGNVWVLSHIEMQE